MAHVFVDGSAFFGDVQALTISASAWVRVHVTEHQVLDKRRLPVPGADQSSFAAELYAVLLAPNKHWTITIYCDCAAVCDLLRHVLTNGHDKGWGKRGLPFFWTPILEHLQKRPAKTVQIVKVRSHRSIETATSAHDAWTIWGNDMVDREAKAVFEIDHPRLFQRYRAAYEKTVRNRADTCMLYQSIATTGQFHIRKHKETKSKEIAITRFEPAAFGELRTPPRGRVHAPSVDTNVYLAFPWGPGFLWRIVDWLKHIRWEDAPVQGADISLMELYGDYCLHTCSISPKNVFTKKQRDKYTCYKYILTDCEARADSVSMTLSEQHHTWVKAITWLHGQCPGFFFPAEITKRSFSLHKIGCSRWHVGMDRRPILTHGYKSATLLNQFFCTSSGSYRTLNRGIDWHFTGRPTPLPAELQVPFTDRVSKIRRAKQIFSQLS